MTDKETTDPALAADQERGEVDWHALYVREKQAWEDAQARHQHHWRRLKLCALAFTGTLEAKVTRCDAFEPVQY